jgi:hypothetical protein
MSNTLDIVSDYYLFLTSAKRTAVNFDKAIILTFFDLYLPFNTFNLALAIKILSFMAYKLYMLVRLQSVLTEVHRSTYELVSINDRYMIPKMTPVNWYH